MITRLYKPFLICLPNDVFGRCNSIAEEFIEADHTIYGYAARTQYIIQYLQDIVYVLYCIVLQSNAIQYIYNIIHTIQPQR